MLMHKSSLQVNLFVALPPCLGKDSYVWTSHMFAHEHPWLPVDYPCAFLQASSKWACFISLILWTLWNKFNWCNRRRYISVKRCGGWDYYCILLLRESKESALVSTGLSSSQLVWLFLFSMAVPWLLRWHCFDFVTFQVFKVTFLDWTLYASLPEDARKTKAWTFGVTLPVLSFLLKWLVWLTSILCLSMTARARALIALVPWWVKKSLSCRFRFDRADALFCPGERKHVWAWKRYEKVNFATSWFVHNFLVSKSRA